MKAMNGSEEKKKPSINMTIRGPLRKQVIVPMVKSNAKLIVQSAHQHIANINNCLRNIKSDIIVDFLRVSNDKVNITMSKLASPSDLTTIEKYIKNINNIALDSIESPHLPKSKLYLKIIGLLHLMGNGIITPDFVKGVLKETHLFKDVSLASKPRIIKASPKSNMAVVWVDIWDSQSSSLAKNIINCCFNIGCFIATVRGMNMNLGILQCKNCWKWGHLILSCCSHISRCAKCYGAHVTGHHREKAWCCMENKKTNQTPTKEGEYHKLHSACISTTSGPIFTN